MTIQEIKELAIHAAKGTAPTEFTVDQVDKALADGFRELAGSVNQFMKNRYDIYDIMIAAADEVVPAKVIDAMGMFAEVQQVGQGQKAIFKRKIGKQRAKQFITRVGLSGVYESFRLDTETFEVSAHAIGGAASIDFERMLDNAETMAEVMEVITEGLVDSLYVETQRALIGALSSQKIPDANKVEANSFDSAKMFKLISTVGAYGNAVIFASPEFVAEMGADAIVPVSVTNNNDKGYGYGIPGVYHPQDIDAIHNQGYINIFRGTPVIKMPQSFTDETNSEVVINPQYAYVLPTGKERVVKIVLEGQTQINDFVNADNSMEIHFYKKMGVAILNYNNWGIYRNTGINADNWTDTVYGF